MNKIEDELKKLFFISNGKLMPITIDGLPSYLSKNYDQYYVAIPYDFTTPINENFVGMCVSTGYANFNGDSIPVLTIKASTTVNIDNLILVASDFIRKENRKVILHNPFAWVDKWRDLFGDSVKRKMVFDLIGEMLALKIFYKNDKTLKWVGREGGTHDIVGANAIYEVKTTVQKTGNVVGIHSSYQLSTEEKLKLIFVRLEKKPNSSLSINSLVNELVLLGYDRITLEKNLSSSGYDLGNRSRDETYDLLSVYSYDVSKVSFPFITLSDINKFAPKNNIIGYELKLDLSSVDKDVIFEKD